MTEFSNLTSFIAHMAILEHVVEHEAEKGLRRAARVISNAAKEELGYYQPEVGPFVAWAPLAASTLEHHKTLGVGESPELVTGQLYASIEDEAQGNEAVSGSKLDIAAYQELGTAKMPPRPIFGPAAWKSREEIEKIIGEGAVKAMLYGAFGSLTALE